MLIKTTITNIGFSAYTISSSAEILITARTSELVCNCATIYGSGVNYGKTVAQSVRVCGSVTINVMSLNFFYVYVTQSVILCPFRLYDMRVYRPKTNNQILNERGSLKDIVCVIFEVTDTEIKIKRSKKAF